MRTIVHPPTIRQPTAADRICTSVAELVRQAVISAASNLENNSPTGFPVEEPHQRHTRGM